VVCYLNPAAADLFGRSPEQMLGSDPGFSLLPGQVTEMEIVRTSGEITTVELHVMETEWENRPAQLLSLRDITSRRTAENEQREWEKLLVALEKEKEMSRIKTGFMTTVIHEFRTPLSIIQAASDLLDKYYQQLTEEKRHLRLETIKTQVRLLDSLLGEISLTVHAELGQLAFEPMLLNLEQFCRRFADDMRQTIGAAHSLHFSADDRYDYEIMGDPKLLMHIVTNLLSNAIKYSDVGTGIDFGLTQDRGDVVITVADHGIGIPAEDQKHLFESFRRGSNVGDIGGTGLGLKVVKDCVTVHQGSLAIESAEGVGTTCTVRIPYIPAT
jgi:signal transduction histidine kinase